MLAGKKTGDFATPAEIVILFEVTPDAGGKRVVGFLDGHVEEVDEQHWATLKGKMAGK